MKTINISEEGGVRGL